MKRRASDVIIAPKLPPVRKGPPIRASELVKRRHQETMAALQRTIEQREQAFVKLARLHSRVWSLGRQVKRYEAMVGGGR